METDDLTIEFSANKVVNIRANLVIIHQNNLLVHTFNEWPSNQITLFGGRVKFAESLEEALLREAKEELNIEYPVTNLTWIDHVFHYSNPQNRKYENKMIHEFSGVGTLIIPDEIVQKSIVATDSEQKIIWLTFTEFMSGKYVFFPESLYESLCIYIKQLKNT